MKKVLAVFLFAIAGSCFASEGQTTLQIRTIGVHFESGNYNNNLYGIGIEHEPIEKFKIGYLYARNSFVETRYSSYIHANYRIVEYNDWSLAVGAAIGNNYKTRTQDDIKTFGLVTVCHQTFKQAGICTNIAMASTGSSASLLVKFNLN